MAMSRRVQGRWKVLAKVISPGQSCSREKDGRRAGSATVEGVQPQAGNRAGPSTATAG